MLAKRFRVPAKEFLRFRKHTTAKKSTTPYFVLKIFPNHVDHNRFGFIVSSKVDQRASRRNAIRRRLAAVAQKNTSGSSDVVVHVLPGARTLPLREMRKEFDSALEKVVGR